MSNDDFERDDAIAYMRYNIILPLIEAKKGEKSKIIAELSQKVFSDPIKKKNFTLSKRQIYRIYANYEKYKFNGLKPKPNKNKGTHPSIPDEIINHILELKKELPSRSAYKIITMLELAKAIPKSSLRERTVNRILQQYGFTRKLLSKDTKVYKKHEKDHINQMWISDVTDGIYINLDEKTRKKCYLIGFIDDCSRRIMHAQFYLDSTLPKLEDCLKKAITKNGIPDKIFVDNGNIYIAKQFKLICAKLDMRLIYSTIFYPQGKGKCEKYWDTVQKSFYTEVLSAGSVNDIEHLNDLFFSWLQLEYQDKVHSQIKMTPAQRWELSIKEGRKLRFISPLEIDDIFLHQELRLIHPYGIIYFQSNTYEGPGSLVGYNVLVKYDPFDLKELKVYYNDKFMGIAKIIDLKRHQHKDLRDVLIEPKSKSLISKMYFDNLTGEYQKYLETKINESLDKAEFSNTKQETQSKDENPLIPIKNKQHAISKNDFIKLIQSITDIKTFTYPEKSELSKVWDILKSFNSEILSQLLIDFKKNPDFDKNFIFYLQQLSSLYIKKKITRRKNNE